MPERRRAPRTRSEGLTARVRPGHRVAVVDVSEGGALIEAHHPLRPGAGVEVQFERSNQRLRLLGTVVRCGVSALDPHRGPTYRAAVSFGEPFAWAREGTTLYGQVLPVRGRSAGGRTQK